MEKEPAMAALEMDVSNPVKSLLDIERVFTSDLKLS